MRSISQMLYEILLLCIELIKPQYNIYNFSTSDLLTANSNGPTVWQ